MIPDGFPACPYPGLRPFELADSPVFFGQDENIEALIERLGRARFVAVLGESGVGKSSLVKAGLIPELRRGDTSLWRIVVFKPGVAPLQAMAEALAGAGLAKQADLVEAASNLRGHRASLRDLIASADLPAEERVLIVVDQFEELFRFRRKDEPGLPEGGAPNASDEEDAALFLKLLLTAAHTSEPPVYVLVTMRSEFLGDCAAFYELGEAMNQGAFLLPRMARHQFAAAITEPLKAYGCDIESPLLHELQNESMALTEDGLPLLQHALRRMWDQRAGDREGAFSMSDFMPPAAVAEKYSNRPALQVLLDAHLDKVYAEMEEAGLGTATVRLMQRLGDHDRKGRLVRRAVDWDTARAVAFWENAETTKEEREQNRELLGLIIGAFHDAGRGRFFLTGEADGRGGNSCRLELTHEVILRQWSRLVEWYRHERRNAEQFQHLAEQANRYPREAAVLRGTALESAEKWLTEFAPTPHWAERYSHYDSKTRAYRYNLERTAGFVRESLRARRNGRLRNAGAVLAALAVACIGIWAWGVLRARSNEVNHIIEALRIAESNVQAALSAQSDIQRNARQEIDRIRNELTTATGQQKETLTKKLNAAESKYNEADSEKHTLVMQINSINRVDQTKIDDLEKRVKTLQGTVSSPTTDLGSAQRALEAAADPKELDRLKTENERLQAENKRLTEPWRETREELQFWKEIWDSRDPAVFEKYLGKYPMGMFSAVAKLRITQLPLKEELPEERSPKKQQPVRVGSRVQEAILIHKILPAYPILAKQARIQGQVSFNGIIGADGQIQTLDLASDPTNLKLLLLKASVDAIAQWRYKPTLVDGKPVAVKTQIDINFLLHY